MITDPVQIAISIIAVTIFGLLSLKVGIVNVTGFVAAEFVGCSILIFGEVEWFIILLSFHFTAGLFTKYKYEHKKKIGAAEEKGGARAWQNVMANGAVASLLAIGHGFTPSNVFPIGFLGAIGTSAADTLATEIGLLNPHKPRLITKLNKSVEPGTSGGVSLLGEVANLLGASLIGLVAWIVGFRELTLLTTLTVTILAGFLGSTFDSLIGASIQATYECAVCDKITERKAHCGQPSKHVRGNRMLDNNVVNLISTIFGALLAALIYFLIS